ncbi:MAG: hypothetical protein H0V81_13885 [Solirubrobacterales bacterium]|nr:hypothetical protein [Solirubrobacterales bacterium]
MSKKKKAAAAGATAVEAVDAVKSNPYLKTITSDGDVHDNVRVAYESARDAYERLASGKSLSKSVLEDKKLHANLATAAAALKDVGTTLADPPGKKRKAAKKKKGGLGRKLLVLVVGAGVAVAVSSDVRNKLLDLLFGAEEEFDYTSTTAPATPAPST